MVLALPRWSSFLSCNGSARCDTWLAVLGVCFVTSHSMRLWSSLACSNTALLISRLHASVVRVRGGTGVSPNTWGRPRTRIRAIRRLTRSYGRPCSVSKTKCFADLQSTSAGIACGIEMSVPRLGSPLTTWGDPSLQGSTCNSISRLQTLSLFIA